MALLIRTDGSQETMIPRNRREGFELDTLLTAVGGYIRFIVLPTPVELDGVEYHGFVVDEDGKRKNKKVNHAATSLWARALAMEVTDLDDVLLGDVVLVNESEVQ
jgi:hypothetical protein